MQHALSFRRGPFIRICWARRVRPALRRAKRAFDPLNLHFHSFGRHDPVRGLPYGFVCCFVPGVSSSPSFVSSASSTTKAATASIEGNFAPSSSVRESLWGVALNRQSLDFCRRRRRRLGRARDAGKRRALLFKTQWTTKKTRARRHDATRGKSFFEARNETAIIIGVVDLFFVTILDHFWRRNRELLIDELL